MVRLAVPTLQALSVGMSVGEVLSDVFHITILLSVTLESFWEFGVLTQYANNWLMLIAPPLLFVMVIPSSLGFGFVMGLRVTKPPHNGSVGPVGVTVGTGVSVGVKVVVGVKVIVGVKVTGVEVGVLVRVGVAVRVRVAVLVGRVVLVGLSVRVGVGPVVFVEPGDFVRVRVKVALGVLVMEGSTQTVLVGILVGDGMRVRV